MESAEITCACGWSRLTRTYRQAVRLWDQHLESGECRFYNESAGQKNLFGEEKKEMTISRERYAGSAILRADDIQSGAKYVIRQFIEIRTALRDRAMQPAILLEKHDDPLPLNTTNLDTLLDAFGDQEENWKGREITLQVVATQTPDGKPAKGVRVEVTSEQKKKAAKAQAF